MSDLSKDEFTRRFVARLIEMAGATFDDGYSIEDHGRAVAESYWADADRSDDGPEACAEEEMSYWGEN